MNNKPEFIEGMEGDASQAQKLDPLYDPVEWFDYSAIDRNLGHIDESPEQESERPNCDPAKLVREIIDFPIANYFDRLDGSKANADQCCAMIGRRLLALAWVINPAYVGGISMRQLAKRLGIQNPGLAMITSAASRRFGIVNRAGGHGWNRKPATQPQDKPAERASEETEGENEG